MTYYPPRIATATRARRCGPATSFRAACIASGFSIAETQALLTAKAKLHGAL